MASAALDDPLGEYRNELFSHCYRMLGSYHDAEDVLQEVSLRALRGLADFEGRSSLRTWLHRIAANTCLNELERKERRVLPMDHTAAFAGDAPIGEPVTEVAWLEPAPDDPLAGIEARESIELAFVAAVQHLPPNQRAALVLFEAFAFSADEIAEIMATSRASVNSALQRARETLGRQAPSQQQTLTQLGDDGQRALVHRYTTAMREHDLDAILALVTEDATWSMPPLANWYRGHDDIAGFLRRGPFTLRWRHRPTSANGQLAVACYLGDDEQSDRYDAYCIDVLDVTPDGRIAGITAFLDASLFPAFGLPETLAADR